LVSLSPLFTSLLCEYGINTLKEGEERREETIMHFKNAEAGQRAGLK